MCRVTSKMTVYFVNQVTCKACSLVYKTERPTFKTVCLVFVECFDSLRKRVKTFNTCKSFLVFLKRD